MSAISYLFQRKIINWFKQLRYNKSKLVMVLFWGIFILFTLGTSFIGSSFANDAPSEPGDFDAADFTGMIMIVTWTALVIFMVVQALYQGTKRGSSVYTSPDIQFIFTGPMRSQNVLIYGMLNSMQSVLISTFFMIYQLPNMRNMGLTWLDFGLFIVTWFMIITIAQLATMTLYLLLFNHQNLAMVIRSIVLALPLLLLVIYAGMVLAAGQPYLDNLQLVLFEMLESPWMLAIPFLGWSLSLMTAVLSGMHIWAVVSAGLLIASSIVMALYISRSEADFYEDAMGLTYERETQLNKQKSGQITRVKKVRKTGLNKGWGADAIFYRQLREYRRTSPFVFSPAMLFYLMGGALVAVFLRGMASDNEFDPNHFRSYGLMIIFCGTIVVMFWHGMFSSLLSELESPLFYTSPAPPMQKLLQASRLGVIKILIDILPSMLIVMLLLQLNPLLMISLVLASLSVYLVISGSQLLVYRLVGKIKGTVETMILILIQGVTIGPTIILIIITFVLLAFNMLSFVWPSLLLIAVINVGLFFCMMPAGLSALRKGLDR